MKKNEKGYALLYALLLSIVISGLVLGVFVKAMHVNNQVENVNQMNGKMDVGELALQEAKTKLGKVLKDKILINDSAIVYLGTDEKTFKQKALEAVVEVNNSGAVFTKLNSTNEKLSYTLNVGNPTIDSRPAYQKTYGSVNPTWLPISETDRIKNEIYAYTADFPIKVQVKNKRGQIKNMSCVFSYDLQWQTYAKEAGEVIAKAEMWGNGSDVAVGSPGVVSKYPRFGQQLRTLLSATSIVRKTNYNVDLNSILSRFPNGETISNQLFGGTGEFLMDYSDLSGVIDWGEEHKIGNNNVATGSLLFEKGVQLIGDDKCVPEPSVNLHNILQLSNIDKNGITKNYLKNVSFNAGLGILIRMNPQATEEKPNNPGVQMDNDNDGMIEVAKKNSQLIIDNDSNAHVMTTPNLVFLNCINNEIDDSSKVNIGQGRFQVTSLPFLADFNKYSEYSMWKNNSRQIDYYKLAETERSSLIIANSRVNLEPITYSINGKNYQTKEDDVREIVVDGNFHLTNLSIRVNFESNVSGYNSYGPNEKLGFNKPTILSMSGKNTSLNVKGITHIDCIKGIDRPPILNQKIEPPFSEFKIDVPTTPIAGKNDAKTVKVDLKNKSKIRLGYASIEPFELAMENDTVFRMKVLPYALRFDPYFIKKWNRKGKIILEVGKTKDAADVEKLVKATGVSLGKVESSSDDYKDDMAENGKVTIVETNESESSTVQGINTLGGKVKDITYN